NKPTDEFLEKLIADRVYPMDNGGYVKVGDDLVALARELQEYRSAAQKAPGDFLSRMHDELNQLRMRAKGLHAFIGTPSFKALREEAKAAMIRQLDVMSEYIEILHHRIRMAESE
ncbi:crAss001_48 related protein, partial [Lelliottia wanjuensis]|uniref:crAss001_48 related protein n=1 Tax=Lelliottia wanjuensis TaxID=3050585 RepID=UPI00254D4448